MLKNEVVNFLRFLTWRIPMSIEDGLASALLRPVTSTVLAAYLKKGLADLGAGRMNLYLHIPYCFSICSYCHCRRFRLPGREVLEEYVRFLIRQMHFFSPIFREKCFDMVCVGGGTPTVLSAKHIARIFTAVDKYFKQAAGRRWQFEGTPVTLTADKLKVLKANGLERISIGVQSMDPVVLNNIGRQQTAEDVYRCLAAARASGIKYVNVDLVAGLPGQSLVSFLSDVRQMISEGVQLIHIYPYSVVCQSKTEHVWIRDILREAVMQKQMMEAARGILLKAGFKGGQLAAYARCHGGEDYQINSYTGAPGSVIGLGVYAKSRLAGKMLFETNPIGNKTTGAGYSLCGLGWRYEMARYAQLQMLHGMPFVSFREVFGRDFEETFPGEYRFLKERGVVHKVQGKYVYNGAWTPERLFDYWALTKVLFGLAYLRAFRERFNLEYDARQDHSAEKDLRRAYHNSWIMTVFFRMGV